MDVDGSSYHKLLQFLNEKQLSKSSFYDEYALPKLKEFSPTTRDAVVLSLLRNLKTLEQTDAGFVAKLLKHPFLPTGPSSTLCHVENVYVPKPKLRRFLDEDVMPSPAFTAPDILQILSRIGLKDELDAAAVLISASTITKKLKAKIDENLLFAAKQRAQALLKYLDEHWDKLKLHHNEEEMRWDEFVEKLRNECWVPVAPDAPHPALVWKWSSLKDNDLDKFFAKPLNIRLQNASWMISATHPTMSTQLESETFIEAMGFNRPPTGAMVATQVCENKTMLSVFVPKGGCLLP